MADAAGVQADERLARSGIRELELGELERRADPLEHRGANPQDAPSGCSGAGSSGAAATRCSGAVFCSSRSSSTE